MNDANSEESRVIDIGDIRLAYIEAGSGAPVVVIADGSGPHLCKSDMILAEEQRVISFGSCRPGSDHEMAASHTIDALEKLGLDRFDLIGHGAGAMVALHMARTAPGVNVVVLAGPRLEPGPAFEDVKCPALTLIGTRDENASLDAGRSIVLKPAHSHLMYVYDGESALGEERPEALAFIVREFFERRNEFLVSREIGRILP